MEASGELSIIDQIKNMTDEYSTKQQEINNVSSLPKTGITEIDDMFAYMQSECNKNKIEYHNSDSISCFNHSWYIIIYSIFK